MLCVCSARSDSTLLSRLAATESSESSTSVPSCREQYEVLRDNSYSDSMRVRGRAVLKAYREPAGCVSSGIVAAGGIH